MPISLWNATCSGNDLCKSLSISSMVMLKSPSGFCDSSLYKNGFVSFCKQIRIFKIQILFGNSIRTRRNSYQMQSAGKQNPQFTTKLIWYSIQNKLIKLICAVQWNAPLHYKRRITRWLVLLQTPKNSYRPYSLKWCFHLASFTDSHSFFSSEYDWQNSSMSGEELSDSFFF